MPHCDPVRDKLFKVWWAMKVRCHNPQHYAYPRYGARGIVVCEAWHSWPQFRDDMLPTYKPGLQIDRIDNDGPYSPENCRWATAKENMRNRSVSHRVRVGAVVLAPADVAETLGVDVSTVHDKINTFGEDASAWTPFRKHRGRPSLDAFSILSASSPQLG